MKPSKAAWLQPCSQWSAMQVRGECPTPLQTKPAGWSPMPPGHLGSLQPGIPHPPMAQSPEPQPLSSTLSPGMWLQRLGLGHDHCHSPPPSPPHPPKEWEPNGTQPRSVTGLHPNRAVDRAAMSTAGHTHRNATLPLHSNRHTLHVQTSKPSTPLPATRKQTQSNSEACMP